MDLSGKRIWALLDERQGNTSQTLGVAEALGVPFEVKKIAFNHWIRLPNILINKTTLGIKPASRALLAPPWPDIVISTARRLGIVASYIKHKNPSTFIAQIQWPGNPSGHFDLIATPRHDNPKPADHVFITAGAPHRVTEATLAREAQKWEKTLVGLPLPRIAVLVGGNSGSRVFSVDKGRQLATMVSGFAGVLHGSLMVTTSRRTGEALGRAIQEALSAPSYTHLWNDDNSAAENPFYGFLGMADAVVATGDSISMCSEACAAGKPVYIFADPEFVSPKHQLFIDDLYKRGLAKPLLSSGNALFTVASRLNDAQDIAEQIQRRYFATAVTL